MARQVCGMIIIQGGFFNWPPPHKNHKFWLVSKCFQKKIENPDWAPPKLKVLSIRIYLPELILKRF